MAIQFYSEGQDTGTTFDNFAFIRQVGPTAHDDHFIADPNEVLTSNVLVNDISSATNVSLSVTAVDGSPSHVGQVYRTGQGGNLKLSEDGSVTYTPHRSFRNLAPGASVEDDFTYTVESGGFSATADFTIAITGPDPAADFRSNYDLAEDGSDDTADWSGNGIANIYYYAFGLGDPNSSDIDASRLPQTAELGNGQMILRYVFPVSRSSVQVSPVTSQDLENWIPVSSLPPEEFPVSADGLDLDENYRQNTYVLPISSNTRFFSVRVRPAQ